MFIETLLFRRAVEALETEQAAADHIGGCEQCKRRDDLCYEFLKLHRDALAVRSHVLKPLKRELAA